MTLKEKSGVLARWAVVVLFFSLATSRSLFAIAGILLLLGFAFEGQWHAKWTRLKSNKAVIFIFLLVAWIYISSLWTKSNTETFAYAVDIYWKLLLIPAIVFLIQDEKWKKRCWQGFSAGMVLLLLHIYAMAFIEIPWSSSGQASGVFFNPLSQSVGLCIFGALCLLKLFESPLYREKLFWLVALFFSGWAVLIISEQRLGYLLWLIGCSLILFIKLKPTNKKLGVFMAAALFFIVYLNNTQMQERLDLAVTEIQNYRFENDYTSVGGRLHMWYSSVQFISQAPVFGHGIGSYPVISESYFQDDKMCEWGCRHPHNQYLFYATEFGLIGLTLFFLFIYHAVKQNILSNPEKSMPLVVLALFVVTGFFDTPLWYRGYIYIFIPLLALSMLDHLSTTQTHIANDPKK